jgi:hypothetical protein
MFQHSDIVTQPLFFLFIGFSALLSAGYLWGRRANKRLFRSAFNALVDVVRPDDQTFTNIGGLVGYHANLLLKRKGPVERVDATITMLPRHSLLYMPVSKFIMRYDRLFVTIFLKPALPGEAHLIEAVYAGFRGPKIENAKRLNRQQVRWGNYDFLLYYERNMMRDRLTEFMQAHPDPGVLRHIALVPDQRKCFVFMIPDKDAVKAAFDPVYQWVQAVVGG